MTVVTFTTDFGTVDGYVGAMKGVVLSLAPDAVLVDITHDIPRHDVAAGAFALAQAAPAVPAGHGARGGGRSRGGRGPGRHRGRGGRRAISSAPTTACWRWRRAARGWPTGSPGPDFRRDPVSPTFHGRDVFAQTAGKLARGSLLKDAGPLLEAIEELPGVRLAEGEQDAAVVVHIDAFGNLITSWPGTAWRGGPLAGGVPGPGGDRRSFELQAGAHLRRRRAGRAAGLRGQRRRGGDRRARGLGRRGHRTWRGATGSGSGGRHEAPASRRCCGRRWLALVAAGRRLRRRQRRRRGRGHAVRPGLHPR